MNNYETIALLTYTQLYSAVIREVRNSSGMSLAFLVVQNKSRHKTLQTGADLNNNPSFTMSSCLRS